MKNEMQVNYETKYSNIEHFKMPEVVSFNLGKDEAFYHIWFVFVST
jgi:hypothetical protein